MKITAIRAYALNVTAQLDITDDIKTAGHQVCVVEIDTDEGITGHGLTAIGPAVPIKAAVLSVAAPELMGCLLYTSPSPRDVEESRMPSSA